MSSGYSSLFDAWSEASTQMFENFMTANRAAVAAMGASAASFDGDDDASGETATEDRIRPAGDLPGWTVEADVGSEGLSVGDRVRFTKTLTEDDVDRFAAASGDTNPIHLDDEWASGTRFGGRIVHGTLVSGLISAALARLPGSVVYLSQDLEFRAPVRLGDRVTAEVEAVEDLGGGRFRLRTQVLNDEDEPVIDGEAVVLIDELPESASEE